MEQNHDNTPRHHVIITGTGRAGTTFLVELLTELGLDTGFHKDDLQGEIDPIARAGLEYDVRDPGAPYIVKKPSFCMHAGDVLKDDGIVIDRVILPVRNLQDAAESRRRVQREAMNGWSLKARLYSFWRKRNVDGGLVYTGKSSSQEYALLSAIYSLIYALAATDTPLTLLEFPKFVGDARYLYSKLEPVVGDSVNYAEFSVIFDRVAQPSKVSIFNR